HRHQHIKPSASIIAKVHILKADIFTLEKPDISILGLHDDSDYGGAYDKSTINKIARVVVTINYAID
ncbi:hypothetical protein QR665_08360, partial [Acinetobacter gerneri]|nr:hypothetical protein [Acinetobacter gerneri]